MSAEYTLYSQPGDTMARCPAVWGWFDALIAANHRSRISEIQPGQIVCVPQTSVVCPPFVPYIVQPGDTMLPSPKDLA